MTPDPTLGPWSSEKSLNLDGQVATSEDRPDAGGNGGGETVTSVTSGISGRPRPQVDRLVELAADVELFCSPTGVPHVTVSNASCLETWPVRSLNFRTWLMRQYHEAEGRIPRAQAFAEATNALAGKAVLSGLICETHVRVASHGGAIYLDLADPKRLVIEITMDGWQIVMNPPVRFRRPRGMLALPVPERGGRLDDLHRLLNLPTEDGTAAMVLISAWLVSTLQPSGALPLLVIGGEQGSAKSTAALILKRVVDPSAAPLRSEPREIDDLMIAATNSRVVAYDNVSNLRPWLSDALCRLATGGGLSKRELYSDAEETILEAQRPVIVTGIEDLATRPDLLDRCLLVSLAPIPDEKRRTEEEVFADFDAAHPRILGALLDAVVLGLRNRLKVRLTMRPRMADFAQWVAACAPALGFAPGTFLLAYSDNRASANAVALDASPVAAAVLRLVQAEAFEETAQDLLQRLVAQEAPDTTRHHAWPQTPRALRGALSRLASSLRVAGVQVTFLPRTGNTRPIRLERAGGALDDGDASATERVSFRPSFPAHAADARRDGGDGHDGSAGAVSAPGSGGEPGSVSSLVDLARTCFDGEPVSPGGWPEDESTRPSDTIPTGGRP